jgi:hypothetical protein
MTREEMNLHLTLSGTQRDRSSGPISPCDDSASWHQT